MNDNTYDDITKQLESNEQSDSQPASDASQQAERPDEKPNQSFAFLTPTEAGFKATDPNDIPAAPRPQPGMTFTPTGGSVSDVHHQLNSDDSFADNPQPQPEQANPTE